MITEDKAKPNNVLTVDSFHQGRSANIREDFVQLEHKVDTKIDALKASTSFQKVLKSKEYKELEHEVKKRNFIHLVQNLIVFSSMSLMPLRQAIGSVMKQLTGSDKPLFGPADVPNLQDPIIRHQARMT